MKKVNAFTLAELVVAMIISSIVMATIYTAYLLIRKQYFRQTTKARALDEYIRFRNALSVDFFYADSLKTGDTDGILLCFKDSSAIEYSFTNEQIVRKSDIATDSFSIPVKRLDLSRYRTTGALVKEISLTVMSQGDTIPLLLQKNYDAATLIKNNPD